MDFFGPVNEFLEFSGFLFENDALLRYSGKTIMIVSKFGGSSLVDASAIKRSVDVAITQGSDVVVVSATYGTTDHLIQLAQAVAAAKGPRPHPCDYESLLDEWQERHRNIAHRLESPPWAYEYLEELFKESKALCQGIHLLRECSPKAQDSILSLGERCSSLLFTVAFNHHSLPRKATLFDIRQVMETDDHFGKANPNLPKIVQRVQECFETFIGANNSSVLVTQGFIGCSPEGATTTLGRGGSDYSASLLAHALDARILQIWTDVAGIWTTDPKCCQEALPIPEISFQEASELATFGAKVLHPMMLQPVRKKGIPVFVGSSFHPHERGTLIHHRREEEDLPPLIRAIAFKRKQTLLTLTTPRMLHTYGLLYKIFKIFNDHKISIDSITTSEISIALTLDDVALLNETLLMDLAPLAHVEKEDGLALISLIGHRINHIPGLARRVFSALADLDVRMICQGASQHSFCFLMDEGDVEEAIRRLHAALLEGRNDERRA